MDILSWWADLGGNLIGTCVGFGLALIWDRRRDRMQEDRDRDSSMRSILLNLEDIDERLGLPDVERDWLATEGARHRLELHKPYIARAPFDAAVASGRLALFPTEMQEQLSITYELIRHLHMHLDILNTIYSRAGGVEYQSAIIGEALQSYSADVPIVKDMIRRAVADLRQFLTMDPVPDAGPRFGADGELLPTPHRWASNEAV